MVRPPSTSSDGARAPAAPLFRFLPAEVEEMEVRLQPLCTRSADRAVMAELATKFNASADRVGKVTITPKQVHNWFCNRRYCSREAKAARAAAQSAQAEGTNSAARAAVQSVQAEGTNSAAQAAVQSVQAEGTNSAARGVGAANHQQAAAAAGSSAAVQASSSSGNNPVEGIQVKYEAKSHRDGAWYDVESPFPYRTSESGEVEALVEFSGFGEEEAEWVNVHTCLRQRSIPLRATECALVAIRDTVLCYKESQQSGLYYDAHVLSRKSHENILGEVCDCTFLVQYEHDESKETVNMRKLCRRPTTTNN